MRYKSFASKLLLIILAIFNLHIFFNSCRHDPEDTSNIREICFEDEILPIFLNSCALSGCHDASSAGEGYVFTEYSNILSSVKPGDSKGSPAYTTITSSWEDRMPPSNPLPLESRQLIRIWIEQGALNTSCKDTADNKEEEYVNPRACFQRDILPVLRSSCAISGCHDAISQKDEYIFTDYVNTLSAVVPGNPQESELYEKITKSELNDRMPPAGYDPLTPAQIDSIYQWIAYGALDEDCGKSCDTTSIMSWTTNIWPTIEANCKGCHSGSNPSGSLLLTSYSQVSAIASNGTLKSVLRATDGKTIMPPSGALSECKIRQMELWIEAGNPNN